LPHDITIASSEFSKELSVPETSFLTLSRKAFHAPDQRSANHGLQVKSGFLPAFTRSFEDWRHGSSGRALVQQAQNPEFKLQYHQKKNKKILGAKNSLTAEKLKEQ
jgi:hypothetical protein